MAEASGAGPAAEAVVAAGGNGIGSRVGVLVLELAVLGGVVWILGWPLPMAAGAAAVLVVSNLVPERFSTVALGAGLLGFAGFLAVYYQWQRIPMVLALFGVVALGVGAVAVWRGK